MYLARMCIVKLLIENHNILLTIGRIICGRLQSIEVKTSNRKMLSHKIDYNPTVFTILVSYSKYFLFKSSFRLLTFLKYMDVSSLLVDTRSITDNQTLSSWDLKLVPSHPRFVWKLNVKKFVSECLIVLYIH